MNTCRLCSDGHGDLIKYSVRHYVHAACGLKRWGVLFFDKLHLWQLERFPVLVAQEHGVLQALEACIERLRKQGQSPELLAVGLGQAVRKRRVALGKLQEAIADELGMDVATYQMIEDGTHGMNVGTLERLCAALQMPMWELVREAEESGPTYSA